MLGSQNVDAIIRLQRPSGRLGICVNDIADDPDRVLEIFDNKRVCLTTTELLEAEGFELEHTQDFEEPTHWTGWLNLDNLDAETDGAVAVRRTVQAAFRGPMSKEEARERTATQDLCGLQPPD